MEYRNTVVFKQIEYLATVKSLTETLNVSLVETKTQKTWFGSFTPRNIEELTSKAGSMKSFAVFCKLLISSLQARNPGLRLDFFSYSDLENIRKGASVMAISIRPSKKKYLIVSYVTEFEKVHYPLILVLQEGESGKTNEVSKIGKDNKTDNARLKQENLTLSKTLSSYEEDFLVYKEKSQKKIQELNNNKQELENEIHRMKNELDSIITQLEEDARKKTSVSTNNEIRMLKQALIREKEENNLLKIRLATCSKEIEVLRESDQANKKMIEMLSRKVDEYKEKRAESPVISNSPKRISYKFNENETEGVGNCLNELESNLSRVQNLLKKHKF